MAVSLPARSETVKIPVLERGPQHERLEFLIGRWTGRLTRFLPGGKTLGISPSLETVWSLGDVWLESRERTELPDGTVIHNRTWLTWDAREGTYTGAWQDNVFAGFVAFRGRWLDEKRLELDTGEFEFFGRSHRVVFTYGKVSDNELTIEMRQAWDGAEPRTVAEGRFTRAGAGESAAGRPGSEAATAELPQIAGRWRIRVYDCTGGLADAEKDVHVEQDGQRIALVYGSRTEGVRMRGIVNGSKLVVQDSALNGNVEMIETYSGVVISDQREIRGELHDLDTSTGQAYLCSIHLVRQ